MYYILKEPGIIKHFAVYPGVAGKELVCMDACCKKICKKEVGRWINQQFPNV
jgi:hypothetical protein